MLRHLPRRRRCVIYIRVSTDEQAKDDKTSLATQETACRAYAEAKGYEVVEVIVDTVSGAKMERPGLDQLRVNLADRKYDVVVAYAVDRMFRDAGVAGVVKHEVKKYKAKLEFVQTPVGEDEIIGNFVYDALVMAAAVERRSTRERVMRNKRAQVEAGKVWTSTHPPYGYIRPKGSAVFSLHPEESEVVRMIFDYIVRAKYSLQYIADLLNMEGIPAPGERKRWKDGRRCIWHSSTISKMVNHPVYKGVARAYVSTYVEDERYARGARQVLNDEPVIIDDTGTLIPAIVDPAVWEQANTVIRRNRGVKARQQKHFFLLRQRVYCSLCGQVMYPQYGHASKSVSGYYCRSRYNKQLADEVKCPGLGGSIKVEAIDRWVWDSIVTLVRNGDTIMRRLEQNLRQGPDPALAQSAESLNVVIKETQLRMDRLKKRMSDTDDDELYAEWQAEWKRLKGKREEQEQELARVRERIAVQTRGSDLARQALVYLQSIESKIEGANEVRKLQLIEALNAHVFARGLGEEEWELRFGIPTTGRFRLADGEIESFSTVSSSSNNGAVAMLFEFSLTHAELLRLTA